MFVTDNATEGKVALVTGAGSGLGEATADAFTKAGISVVCFDLDGNAAERVRERLSDSGLKNIACQGDVGDAETVTKTVQSAISQFGRLDIVVNCAAIDHTVSVDEMTIEQWDQVIAVNLRGPFLTSKTAFAVMKSQGSGHIVNIASTASTRAWANASAYHASKWGLVGFGRGLGVEGRPFGIKVTTIIPGGMKTHFFDRFVDQGIPLPSESDLQSPANVADVILFAVQMPEDSVLQEVIVTPPTETSWP